MRCMRCVLHHICSCSSALEVDLPHGGTHDLNLRTALERPHVCAVLTPAFICGSSAVARCLPRVQRDEGLRACARVQQLAWTSPGELACPDSADAAQGPQMVFAQRGRFWRLQDDIKRHSTALVPARAECFGQSGLVGGGWQDEIRLALIVAATRASSSTGGVSFEAVGVCLP